MTFSLLLTYLQGIFPVWFGAGVFAFLAVTFFLLVLKLVGFVKSLIPFV